MAELKESSLLLSIAAGFPGEHCRAFRDELADFDLEVQYEEYEHGPMASVILLVPTLVALLFAKPFFESIAKKAGEDAYPHLKAALFRLTKGIASIPVRIVGKQPSGRAREFSRGISFYAKLNDDRRVKFLMRAEAPDGDYQAAIESMCDLLLAHYADAEQDSLEAICAAARKPGRLILLEFDAASHQWMLLELVLPDGRPMP